MKAEKTRRFIDMFLLSEKKEFPNNRLERQPSPKETQMLFHGVHVELAELERLAQIGRYTEMAFEEIMPDFTIGLDTESRNFTTVNELIEWGEANEDMV